MRPSIPVSILITKVADHRRNATSIWVGSALLAEALFAGRAKPR